MNTDANELLTLEPGMLRIPAGLGENAPGKVLPMAPLIRSLADRLDESGILWAVLRNAGGLPEFTRYDLDVLVSPSDVKGFVNILGECARENDWRVVGRIRKRNYTCLMLMQGAVTGEPFFLPIDLFTSLEFRGLKYGDAVQILKRRIRSPNGIWALPAGVEAAITLLKELFPHGVLKENSRDAVQAQALADPEGFRLALDGAVGPEISDHLVDAVRQERWKLSGSERRELRRGTRRCHPGWRRGLIHSVLAGAMHLFRPSLGAVLCLAGADGSGKTTLARGLFERTYKQPFKACRYIHGNIGVLPRFRDIRSFLGRILGRASGQPPASLDTAPLKGMMDPIPAWKSMMLATYYAIDLCLGRLPLRLWRGQWSLVIMDRSFYDYYYQLGHRRCPHWFLNLLSCFVPKPDLLLCIEGDPEHIHARKPELTVEEIRNEQSILRGLAARLPFARRLDGATGIEPMIEAGRRDILRCVVGRAGGGLRCWTIGKKPLLAHSAINPGQSRRALTLFPRTTQKRTWLYRMIWLAMVLRLEKFASKGCASADELLPAEEWEPLLDSVRKACGGKEVDWLITWPAQLERKRLYLMFRTIDGKDAGVVKIGAGDFNCRQFRNEAETLARLASKGHPFSIPSVLFIRSLPGGRTALALRGFPGSLQPVSRAKASVAMAEIARHLKTLMIPAVRGRAGESPWFPVSLGRIPEGAVLSRLQGLANAEVDFGFAHGDLGPGNMMDDGKGGVFLFDWENASAQAPVVTDTVGAWLACRQDDALRDPKCVAAELRKVAGSSGEGDLLIALAFLCAHENLAAMCLLENWV